MSRFTADASAALGGPDWLRDRRAAAFERFTSTPLPSGSEEVWRFSRIADLDLDRYAAPSAAAAADAALPAQVEAVVAAIGEHAGLVVVRDGRVVSSTLDEALATKGVAVGELAAFDDPDELLAHDGEVDVFGELNDAFAGDTVVVRVPKGVAIDRPIVIAHSFGTDGGSAFPRTIVRAGEVSEVTVVECMASPDIDGLVVPIVDVSVGEAANVRYLGVQQLGPRVWQIAHQTSTVQRDATLQAANVVLGGDYARVRTDSRLEGQGGTSNLLAVYFGSGNQMHDFRTLQDHVGPKTTSDLLFKGAVGGHARGVYSGLIRVRKGAKGTNAFQTNRNLVLSEGAHADSVPNLEIEENDVKCSHASAVGPVEEEQRYYLESRGVPPTAADRLIVLGFFDDILERTPVPGLRPYLQAAVTDKLDQELL
ncbi:MAG TPA: Fe-S cluster assembly protein SufD [Acidimicrobiales bacterium]|nr:Fe-S cluster assembly protein SufD [Acidimicrobiales bacterium]